MYLCNTDHLFNVIYVASVLVSDHVTPHNSLRGVRIDIDCMQDRDCAVYNLQKRLKDNSSHFKIVMSSHDFDLGS